MQQAFADSEQQSYDPEDPYSQTFVPQHPTHLHIADDKASASDVTSSPACLYKMS
jgi:hypothetical protein